MSAWIAAQSQEAQALLALTVIWFSGFIMSRATKAFGLPNVTGYILAGVAIGPYCLDLLPAHLTGAMSFMTDAALALIAFGVGRYMSIDHLRGQGRKVILLTLMESLTAAVVVTAVMLLVFRLPLAFSLCAAIAAQTDSQVTLESVLLPLGLNVAVLIFSYLMGRLLCLILQGRSTDHRVVLTCAFITLIAGTSAALDISPLLGCMVLGATVMNFSRDKALFKQMTRVAPPVNMMFFVLSGMLLSTIILSSSVLYEMIGPLCAKRALVLSGAIPAQASPILSPDGKPLAPPAPAPKPAKDDRETKEAKEAKEVKEAKEAKDTKAAKNAKPPKSDKKEKPAAERDEHPPKKDKKADKAEKTEKPEKTEKTEKSDKADKAAVPAAAPAQEAADTGRKLLAALRSARGKRP